MEEKINDTVENKNEQGIIKIHDEVIAVIAGLAVKEIPGVAGMSGGLTGGITEALGRKNATRGVKVEVGQKEAAIDLYIIVEYGYRIPDVAWSIQEKVKKDVEEMTGLRVVEVNIHVQGISFEKENKKEEARKEEARKEEIKKEEIKKAEAEDTQV